MYLSQSLFCYRWDRLTGCRWQICPETSTSDSQSTHDCPWSLCWLTAPLLCCLKHCPYSYLLLPHPLLPKLSYGPSVCAQDLCSIRNLPPCMIRSLQALPHTPQTSQTFAPRTRGLTHITGPRGSQRTSWRGFTSFTQSPATNCYNNLLHRECRCSSIATLHTIICKPSLLHTDFSSTQTLSTSHRTFLHTYPRIMKSEHVHASIPSPHATQWRLDSMPRNQHPTPLV